MLFSFLVYVLAMYGLSFLIADAHIFGCDAHEYEHLSDSGLEKEAYKPGMLNIRPYLLQHPFFLGLFKCYFCMGAWCGPFVHFQLLEFYGSDYWMYHGDTLPVYVKATAINVTIGSTLNYATNLVFKRLEG
jgi:hypothetical protein